MFFTAKASLILICLDIHPAPCYTKIMKWLAKSTVWKAFFNRDWKQLDRFSNNPLGSLYKDGGWNVGANLHVDLSQVGQFKIDGGRWTQAPNVHIVSY